MVCGPSCWYAEEEICTCECHGQNHGTYKQPTSPEPQAEKIKPWTQEQEKAYKEFIASTPSLHKITGFVPETPPEEKPKAPAPVETPKEPEAQDQEAEWNNDLKNQDEEIEWEIDERTRTVRPKKKKEKERQLVLAEINTA